MIRYIIAFLFVFFAINISIGQEKKEVDQFWSSLQSLCNTSYKGTLVLPENDPQFE